MNKKIGIWLDSKNAIILSISANEEKIYKVNSNVESRVRYNGESKTYTRMGKLYIDPEKNKEERKLHQLKNYFNEIKNYIRDASEIYITGPAQAKIMFKEELKSDKRLFGKIKAVETSDSMTEKMIAAKIRKYFSVNK